MKQMSLEEYFYPTPDKRVENWLFMDSVYPVIAILALYLSTIYKIGPSFMEKRRPYNLKTLLAIYNLGQVVVCIALAYEILSIDPRLAKFWVFIPVQYDDDPKSLRMLDVCYLAFWVKIAETLETVFFVLRKKQSQISGLHVYHHCMTIVLAWMLTKYVGGGSCLFTILLNSSVHIIMYSYYLVALLGQNVQRKLHPVKRSITIIQMLQFCLLLLQAGIHFAQGYVVPFFIQVIYLVSVTVIFYMFYDFYKRTYNMDKKKKV